MKIFLQNFKSTPIMIFKSEDAKFFRM